jgi:hypothetical protein
VFDERKQRLTQRLDNRQRGQPRKALELRAVIMRERIERIERIERMWCACACAY